MNMFVRLMYLFFLVTITTVVIGIPLKADLVNTSLIKRDTLADCSTERFVFKTSKCITTTTIMLSCIIERNVEVSQKNCSKDETCIDYVNEQNEPFAMCTNNNNVKKWNNEERGVFSTCSPLSVYSTANGTDIITGMTTYATNNVPIQVFGLSIDIDNNGDDDTVFQQQSHSKIIKNYNGSQVEYCFAAGTNTSVTAYAAALSDLKIERYLYSLPISRNFRYKVQSRKRVNEAVKQGLVIVERVEVSVDYLGWKTKKGESKSTNRLNDILRLTVNEKKIVLRWTWFCSGEVGRQRLRGGISKCIETCNYYSDQHNLKNTFDMHKCSVQILTEVMLSEVESEFPVRMTIKDNHILPNIFQDTTALSRINLSQEVHDLAITSH
ncbi:30453_t:CDS:2 [Gigaspora margarita]|uniref:30453_t:CDS:1 n=1 Tax=Gigaspora margarita TaxID=4874 RepID=A0ABN7W637_GIGMA|nr:30453_t:CDS:2 [Gigaspora margarita]